MNNSGLQKLVTELPDHVLLQAIKSYVYELGLDGNLEKALLLLEELRKLPSIQSFIVELSCYLTGRFACRGNLERALEIYGNMADDDKFLQEKIKAANILIGVLLPDQVQKAWEIWNAFTKNPIPQNCQWHWAKCGVMLLEYCDQSANPDLAEKIFYNLKRCANSEIASTFRIEAEKIMRRLSFN